MNEHFVYGVHAVTALFKNRYRKITALYINAEKKDERLQPLLHLAEQRQMHVYSLSSGQMAERFSAFVHQGVVASANPLPSYQESDLSSLLKTSKLPFILILDGVTDPHNLGACLRTADAAGADFVIIPKDKSASITPVVTKVASGAVESIPLVRVTNLARTMTMLKEAGIWIYGAVPHVTQTIYNINFQSAIALALGSEGSGLRRLTRDHCDGFFSLPMNGAVESLNVSVATGIALYEVLRQRAK